MCLAQYLTSRNLQHTLVILLQVMIISGLYNTDRNLLINNGKIFFLINHIELP